MITGGSGYFGTALNLYLSNKGHEVWSYDAGFFKDNWLGPPVKLNEKWIDARDITETDIQLYDAIIHFAGISNDPLKQLSEDELHRPSLIYTNNLANICKKLGKKFIFASSCSVYGYSKEIVDETSQPNPLTPYSATKLQIEKILNELKDETWQPIILRFATIFGFSPRMRFDTVINMFCGMVACHENIILNSNGAAIRPFVFLDDACMYVELFLLFKNLSSKFPIIFNIGKSENNFAINEIAKLISSLKGTYKIKTLQNNSINENIFQDRKIVSGADTRSYAVSFEKLKTLDLSINQTLSFEDQIQKTIAELVYLNLNGTTLRNISFYRLQSLEYQIENHHLNYELRFKNSNDR